MRVLPLFAAIVMLGIPTASAGGGSSVALSGPTSPIDANGPATATLGIVLSLQGVACAGEAEIPVQLRIVETKGLRSASLTWESVLFRIAGHGAATTPWRGESEVGVRVWGEAPTGHAKVLASYALPPHCVVPGGMTTGEATYTLFVDGPDPPPEPLLPPAQMVPRSESILGEPAQVAESSAPKKPTMTIPLPVMGAIAGMCAGGMIVLHKRLRPTAR